MYRYLFAGALSVAIHFLIFAPLFKQPAMAIPMSQQPTSVSLRFTTVTKPTPKQLTAEIKTAEKVVAEIAKPTPVTTKKRIVKEKKVAKKAPPKKSHDTAKVKTPKKTKIAKKAKKQPTPVKVAENVKAKSTEKIAEMTPKALPTPEPQMRATKENSNEVETPIVSQNNGMQGEPQLIEKSRFLSKPKAPKYPRVAKRKGIEGTVTYEVWLDEKGKQIKLLLKDSSGAEVLDVAALEAIKTWEFSPHSINGKEIAHRIYVPVSFRLD